MLTPDIAAYARHSRWSDPGPFGPELDRLSASPTGLPELVSGLVLHRLFARDRPTAEASLRKTTDILAAIAARDPRPLDAARTPDNRVIGTCRNFALIACAILRQHRVPARLRVGFAGYFTPGFWEDHWLCEYHDGSAWRLLDAELGSETTARLAIPFPAADVPRDRFLAAGPAWQSLRRGAADPERFGVSALGLDGLWFVAGSQLRDLAALGMEEMMPWDHWGPSRGFRSGEPVPEIWLGPHDRLAEALADAPSGRDEAQTILAGHPWAALTASVLSFPEGKPVEESLTAS